jgi:uncharacterized protein
VAEPTVRFDARRDATVRAVAIGIVAGALSGLFGVGGGILIVPALVFVLGFDQRYAHGTSLASVLPIAAAGLIGFALEDSVDWAVSGLLIVGAAAGAVVGTRLLHAIPLRPLAFSFAGLMLVSAVRLVLVDADGLGRDETTVAMGIGLIVFGFVSGVLAGLLGVGGGVIMVPGMVILFGLTAAVAKGTSLAVIIPTALTATRRNVAKGNADIRLAVTVGLAGVVTSYLMSQVSVDLDEDLSNGLFALLLTFVALRLLWGQRRTA